MRKRIHLFVALSGLVGLTGCSKEEAQKPTVDVSKSFETSGGEDGDAQPTGQCSAGQGREVTEYDTTGDGVPDVRKVFQQFGEGVLARLILICRESDLNGDGIKDVVRYYNDEGQPLREEADRDFDGRMDQVTYFQDGQILRQEFDSQGDGKVDTKIFFENGRPLRAERDLTARSTADKWRPDRWEYYEEGRIVRMGTDLDGDGVVDRWDRDQALRRSPDLGDQPSPTDDA